MQIDLPGNLCVVGLQWGDEGKGKLVSLLADPQGPCGRFDYVVRYGGGANAGHTVVIGEKKFAMHLVPSGIVWPEITAVVANGVVVDPEVMLTEISELRKKGVVVGKNLKVSSKAHLIFPYHKLQDKLSESQLGKGLIGTTCRGIGPCYADKATRTHGIRVGELYDRPYFKEKLERIVADKNCIFQALYGEEGFDPQEIYDQYCSYADQLEPFVCDTTELLHGALRKGERIMFEGAQGALLDLDHGTFPYVTSSNSTSCGLFAGAGVPPGCVSSYLGVIKAYSTRVGSGPFPTELDNQIGQYIRDRGREYGTTTGRARRTGWFDAVAVRYSAAISGITAISVMLLDVLAGLETIRIAVAYEYEGRTLEFFPADVHVLEKVRVVYEELPGWQDEIGDIRSQDQLPAEALNYLRRLQQVLECPIKIASVGPEKGQTIPITL